MRTPENDSYPAATLARGSNALGFDLYRRRRETPGNLVISPSSITTALTLAWAAPQGRRKPRCGGSSIWRGPPAR